MFTKAPPAAAFEQRWSVWAAGFGGSQTTRWQCGARLQRHDQQHRRHRGRRRLSASRRSRSRVSRSPAAAPISASPMAAPAVPICSRPAPIVRHTIGPAYISAALAYGWQDVTTNRTVTVAGVDQLRARVQRQRLSRAASRAAIASSRRGSAASAHALCRRAVHHLRSAGLCRAGDVRRQRLRARLCAQRASPTRAANSAFAPTSPLRCRTACSRCAAASPGRMTSIPTARSPRPSRRCRARASSSTARRRRTIPRSTTASAEMKWLNGWSAAATFEGEFSDVTRSYAGKGVVR